MYGLWAAIPPFVANENLVTTFDILLFAYGFLVAPVFSYDGGYYELPPAYLSRDPSFLNLGEVFYGVWFYANS